MNFCWAGVYSVYKVLGPSLPSGGIVTLRFGLAGICMMLIWPWLPGPTPRGKDLWITCLLGLMVYVAGQRLQVYGNQLGTAGNSSVLMSVEPLLTSLGAAVLLREHIGPRRLMGFALALVGVGLLNGVWRKDFQWTSLTASLIFLSSFLCESAYSVFGKPVVLRSSPTRMLAISLMVGLAGNLLIDGPATVAAARELSMQAWVLLMVMAVICTAVGYSLWFVVIRECPVNVAALTVFTQSIFGVAIAAVWLGEELHRGQLLGSLAIVTGLVLGLSRQVHKPGKAPPEPLPADQDHVRPID